jgi:flagellar FliL protein
MSDDMEIEGGKKGGGLKKIIVIAVVLVVVLGGAAAALMFLAPGLVPGLGEKPAETPAAANGAAPGVPALGVIFPLNPFIVNLRDPLGKRYLKVEMSFELPNEGAKQEVAGKLPPIRNDILLLLSNQSFEDIADSEGKRRLRDQVKDRANAYLTDNQVINIYFSEFVVQ